MLLVNLILHTEHLTAASVLWIYLSVWWTAPGPWSSTLPHQTATMSQLQTKQSETKIAQRMQSSQTGSYLSLVLKTPGVLPVISTDYVVIHHSEMFIIVESKTSILYSQAHFFRHYRIILSLVIHIVAMGNYLKYTKLYYSNSCHHGQKIVWEQNNNKLELVTEKY